MKNPKIIYHSPSAHDVILSSPSIFGNHRSNILCMTLWRFIQKCRFLYALKQYSVVYFAVFPHILVKTNTIPILMHQMRISTNQVSSVMLRPKKLEIRGENVKTVISRANKNQNREP
jgi:hypothetical protein